jgi:hypothetical protein
MKVVFEVLGCMCIGAVIAFVICALFVGARCDEAMERRNRRLSGAEDEDRRGEV